MSIETSVVDSFDKPFETTSTPVVEKVEATTVNAVTSTPPEIQTGSTAKLISQPKIEAVQTKKVGITFEQKIAELKKTGSVHMQSLITELEIYIFKMAPGKPIDATDGAHMQYVLWKTIDKITRTAPREEFKALWSILLGYFYNYREGVFNERYVYRFADQWNHSNVYLEMLQRIINLIKLTCDQSSMQKGLNQVSLKRTLDEGFDEEARQRIISYYGK